MQTTRVLALIISIVSFQSLQATSSSTSTHQKNSAIITADSSFKKESEGLWGQLKYAISTWMPSFSVSSHLKDSVKHIENKKWSALAEKRDQSWAQEWSQLVGHMAEENAKRTKSLLTQMKYRKGEHLIGQQQGMAYYEKVAIEVSKSSLFVKEQDEKLNKSLEKGVGFLLTHLADQADAYLESQNSDIGRLSLINYAQNLARFYQSIEQQELKLDQDYFDGDLFQQGSAYAKGLFEISHLERSSENLPRLKSLIKELYTQIDGGKLSEYSQETLSSLNIDTDLPQRRSSWISSRTAGTGLLFLVASSGLITTAAAARPSLLENYCSTSGFIYGTCESAFGAPVSFEPQINSIKSNVYFQQIITDKILQSNRQNSIIDTIIRIGSMQSQFYGELITSRTDIFSGGNVTMNAYFKSAPYLGIQEAPISSTQFNRITFNMTNTADSSAQTTNSYVLTGRIQPFYFGQIENSERMILALQPVNDTSFVYGVVVDRPFGGAPKVVREGVMTSPVRAIYPGSLTSSTTINNNNPSGSLPVESVDSLISSRFYSGNVAGTDGSNPRPISQYFEDIGFTTSNSFLAVKNCLASPGVSPLGCISEFSALPGFTSSLYVFATQPNAVVTLSRNLLQGTNYTEATYQADSGNSFGISMNYDIQPINTATRTNSTLPIPFSTLRGTLPLNQIEKIWIYNPDPANSELGYVIRTTQNSSGTSTSYYVVPGQGITTFPSNPSTPTGPAPTGSVPVPTPDSPQEPGTPSSPSGMSTTTIIAIAVPVGVAVLAGGIFGLVFGLKKHKENKKSKLENEDLENGNGRRATSSTALIAMDPENSPQRGITREGLAPTQRGMFSGTTVDGKLNGKRYGIYFKVTEDEFDDILAKTGLKKVFTPAGSKMDLVLGGGNFGQVRVAKDLDTDELVAVKIVPGTEKVTSSLREGNLQTRLRTQPFVMPLDDRTHYDPKAPKDASPEEIQSAKIASSESLKVLKKAYGPVEMQKLLDKEKKYLKRVTGTDDQQGIELLLQASPLASLGNGEDLSYYLSFLDGIDDDLKSKIIVYVSYHVMKGLLGFHDFGMSHLDLKAANILSSWKSILIQRTKKGPPSKENVWVSDVGCTAQNTTITGGNGDVSYFPPERSQHVCYFLQTLRKKEKVNPNYSYANFNGFAADNFAAGLTILELIMNQHPLQDLFDTLPEGGVREYMLEEWTPEICTKTLEAIFAKFEDTDNDIFKIIRGLTHADPKLRWSTKTALEALEKLLPKEDGDKLFSQLEQKLQESQKVKTPEVGMDLVHEYRPSNRQYLQGEQEKLNYQVLPTGKPNLGDVYGAKDPNFKELLAIYGDQPHYTDFPKEVDEEKPTYTNQPESDSDEEEVTYTDFAQVATSSNPPPRNNGKKPTTTTEWAYQ